MITMPQFEKGGFIPNFKVLIKGHLLYEYKADEEQKNSNEFLRSISYRDFFIKKDLLVVGDVKI